MIVTKSNATPYDVVLSHSVRDETLAAVVKRKLEEAGLAVFGVSSLDFADGGEVGAEYADAVREALTESSALLALVTPAHRDSPSLGVEVGAAWVREKPVYVLLAGDRSATLPPYLRRFQVHPLSELDRVIRAIARGARPLGREQQQALADAYERTGVPVDRLRTDPGALEELARAFTKGSGLECSGERLVRELLRLRKQGRLLRLQG
jgi:hypothetical protein